MDEQDLDDIITTTYGYSNEALKRYALQLRDCIKEKEIDALDAILLELESRMTEREFIKFCEKNEL